MQFCKAVDFTLALLYPNFKLRYLMNYSSDFNIFRLPGTVYVPLGFGVVLFAKVCFFLPVQFCKAVDFTLALLYPNFKLQYLLN